MNERSTRMASARDAVRLTRLRAIAARRAISESERRLALPGRSALEHRATPTVRAQADAERQAAEQAYKEALERLAAEREQLPGFTEATLSATTPVALFPIRIETRFRLDLTPPQLLVRVYPDALLADAHEPLLTDAEAEAGRAFWQDGWVPEAEASAWATLWGTYGGPRAAWIAHATEPTNLLDRPAAPPVFADITTRASGVAAFPEARLLPQRWLFVAYRDEIEVKRQSGGLIREPLPLSLGLGTDAADADLVDISGDGLLVEREVLWTVDFAEAEAAGMALRVDLDATDIAQGFSRVVVVGLDMDDDPEAEAGALEALLEAHRYSRGFAFVPQGAATNNSTLGSSAYPPSATATSDFALERAERAITWDADGMRFAQALGLADASVARASGADGREQVRAEAMAEALWPVTLGYALPNLMLMTPDESSVELVRDHFTSYVRGRGPLPAFRVGDLPYGVLPVLPPGHGKPTPSDVVERHLPAILSALRSVWEDASTNAPRIDRTGDDDADLLETLGLDASAREVRVRSGVGPDATRNVLELTGEQTTEWYALQAALSRWAADALHLMAWSPRVLALTFASDAYTFNGDLVTGPLSETSPLAFDYIAWLRTQGSLALRSEVFPEGTAAPDDLLYPLLRHALLLEYDNAAKRLYVDAGLMSRADLVEPELVGILAGTLSRKTAWDRLEAALPTVSGSRALGDYLQAAVIPQSESLRATQEALAALEAVPSAELERLLAETLDACTNRLDAWLTSLATRRLAEVRAKTPLGVHLGAYGWVEHLRPRTGDTTVTLADGTFAVRQTDAEYLHAPSMDQAGAAAVLRSGALTRRDEGAGEYDIDLSSARVRGALGVLDAVRAGQTLGAILGYRLERGLHDAHLDVYIEPMRTLYPLTAAQRGTGTSSPLAAARNVVHGLDARTDWRAGTIPWGTAGLPSTGADRDAIEGVLTTLDGLVDGVADLLLAESVYQLTRGNVAAGGASLESLASGVRPPEPAFAEMPRSGTPLTHRVALVLQSETLPAAWSSIVMTPRAIAEPRLNAWVATNLGDPGTVRCRVTLTGADGVPRPVEVSLAALGLQALDVLAVMSTSAESLGATTEVDRRVALAAGATATDTVSIAYARPDGESVSSWRTFAELAEIARALAAALSVARPLAVRDLVAPEDGESATSTTPSDARAGATYTALTDASTALASAITDASAHDGGSERAALIETMLALAAFGLPGTVPSPGATTADLIAAALTAQAEVVRRLAAADAATDDAARVAACLGASAWFLPRFVPDGAEGLAGSLAVRGTLTASAREPRRWLRQNSLVRAPLGTWRRAWEYAAAFGGSRPEVDLVQFPDTVTPWCALPFADASARPAPGTTALVAWLDGATLPAVTDAWCGLLIDTWVEIVPAHEETTGLAFRYDAPGAVAPHTVLLAVPPEGMAAWDIDAVLDTVREALDLTRLRAVDGDLLGSLAQALPAVYLAANEADATISLRLTGRVIAAPQIIGLTSGGGA